MAKHTSSVWRNGNVVFSLRGTTSDTLITLMLGVLFGFRARLLARSASELVRVRADFLVTERLA